MRYFPENEEEMQEFKELNAEDWMLDLLKKNPTYNSWGNFEDYMCNHSKGWDSCVELDSVDELFELDDYNELVNFYFEVSRKSKECEKCKGSGLNEKTKKLSDDWYGFNNPEDKWKDKLTETEIDALWDAKRLYQFKEKPTPDEVNELSKKSFIHDSINQWICVKARAKKEGYYGHCDKCSGSGRVYTEPKAKMSLQMWILHPRKGASRGVYLKNIEEHEVETVLNYLREVRDRNAERFSRL